jgi:hypothetical protein
MMAHRMTPIIGLTLIAAVTTACGTTTTSATAPSGEVSALARDSHTSLGKGELMGSGVGAAAGALYDVKKRR